MGTIYLSIFWPSFNAALAPEKFQQISIMNTIIALSTSAVFSFLASKFVRGERFSMQDIQLATISGGIAMGSVHSLTFDPVTSMIMGAISGVITVLGLSFGKEFIWRTFRIHDTLGVVWSHFIPGIFIKLF
jgi:ammonium transporter Rh